MMFIAAKVDEIFPKYSKKKIVIILLIYNHNS